MFSIPEIFLISQIVNIFFHCPLMHAWTPLALISFVASEFAKKKLKNITQQLII